MEYTTIGPARTVVEIQDALARAGANGILLEYENKQPSAVSFRLDVGGRLLTFRLPCRIDPVKQMLAQSGRRPKGPISMQEWAERVAWRQVLRWVEAQLAMVAVAMVKLHEVFLPYMQVRDGITLFEEMESTHFKQLEHKP